jgi:hypothetical protein
MATQYRKTKTSKKDKNQMFFVAAAIAAVIFLPQIKKALGIGPPMPPKKPQSLLPRQAAALPAPVQAS